jgi:hypothetical protein
VLSFGLSPNMLQGVSKMNMHCDEETCIYGNRVKVVEDTMKMYCLSGGTSIHSFIYLHSVDPYKVNLTLRM